MTNTDYRDKLFQKEKGGIGYDTMLLVVLAAVLLALVILVFNFSLCEVKGPSMQNTLQNEQYVLLLKTSNAITGDIIVFHKKDNAGIEKNYIKRVIAVGGETIRFVSDESDSTYMHVEKRNDVTGEYVRMDESYTKDGKMTYKSRPDEMQYSLGTPIDIADDCYFVMGDNRDDSSDSRGTTVDIVHKSQVTGRAAYIIKQGGLDEWLFGLIFRPDKKE